jgi:hypothetical protein
LKIRPTRKYDLKVPRKKKAKKTSSSEVPAEVAAAPPAVTPAPKSVAECSHVWREGHHQDKCKELTKAKTKLLQCEAQGCTKHLHEACGEDYVENVLFVWENYEDLFCPAHAAARWPLKECSTCGMTKNGVQILRCCECDLPYHSEDCGDPYHPAYARQGTERVEGFERDHPLCNTCIKKLEKKNKQGSPNKNKGKGKNKN